MARSLPWTHGTEGTRPAVRLSARVRQHEAILEARSSLEQYSGMHSPTRTRQRVAGVPSLPQRLALAGQRIWTRGPAAWIGYLRGRWGKDRIQSTARIAAHPALAASILSWRRLPAHLGILLLVGILVLGGGFRGALAQPIEGNQGGFSLFWQQPWRAENSEGVLSAYASIPAVPVLIQRPRLAAPDSVPAGQQAAAVVRGEVITYTVESGDNLTGIADRFGLGIETLYWFNGLKSADLLQIGQLLRIPPMDGLIHEVKEGESLDSIAEEYKVRKGTLIAYAANNLREPYTLEVDQKIFVPGASKPIPRPAVSWRRPSSIRLSAPSYAALPGGERFSWPAIGTITDRFGWTGDRWHTGLDISAPWGTPIYAAAAGTATYSGWRGNYGNCVEIDHGEGWATRYGHMAQQPDVGEGQWVERGQLIGYIGCTGKCTGPHVHFEIYYQGAYADPLGYLQ